MTTRAKVFYFNSTEPSRLALVIFFNSYFQIFASFQKKNKIKKTSSKTSLLEIALFKIK